MKITFGQDARCQIYGLIANVFIVHFFTIPSSSKFNACVRFVIPWSYMRTCANFAHVFRVHAPHFKRKIFCPLIDVALQTGISFHALRAKTSSLLLLWTFTLAPPTTLCVGVFDENGRVIVRKSII